jgi:hypothetical protein
MRDPDDDGEERWQQAILDENAERWVCEDCYNELCDGR